MKALKIVLKVLGGLVALILVAAGAGYVFIAATWEKDHSGVPLPAITASADPAVIQRGEYVVRAIGHCTACHVPAEASKKLMPGDRPDLVGGFVWDIPVFGRFVSANITPDDETGIGKLTDGQIARAIRNGIGRDGRTLAFMSMSVGQMSDDDLTAAISYLRSRPPVPAAHPKDKPGFVGKLILKSLEPARDPAPPDAAPGVVSVARGRYLALGVADCAGCHTHRDPMKGFALAGALLSGEQHADPDETDPTMEIATPNLTPDPETGHIVSWSEDVFVARFKKGGHVLAGSRMPWNCFGELSETDLKSLFAFLRSLPPTKNLVGPPRRKVGWKPGDPV